MPRWLLTALKFALSFGLCAYLLLQVDWPKMHEHIVVASVPLLLLGLFFVFLQVFLTTWRWALVLRIIGAPMRLMQAVKISFVANTFAQLLPIASGGDLVRVWQGVRQGMRLSTSMNSVVLERLTGLLALMGMLCIALPTLSLRITDPTAQLSLFVALLTLLGGMILLLLGRYILKPFAEWRMMRAIIKLSEDTHKIIASGRDFMAVLVISVAGLLSWCFAVYIFVQALGLSIALLDAVILVLPVILLLALPFSLTGWGVREGAMVVMLGLAGLDYEQALLVSLITGFAFLMTGLPGAFMLLYLGRDQVLGSKAEQVAMSAQIAGCACPFCASDNASLYLKANAGTIYCCKDCNGLYVIDRRKEFIPDEVPQPNAPSRQEAVQKEYQQVFTTSDISGHAIACSVMESLIKAGVKGGKVLDVGSGSGKIGRVIANEYTNFEWQGIELSPYLYEVLDPTLKLKVIHAPDFAAALAQVKDRSISAIIMNHVLEHLPTPADDLKLLATKLAPDGVFFIEVPNEQWKRPLINVRKLLSLPSDEWFPGHINFFTAPVLRQFLTRQGFRIVSFRKMTAAGYPALFAFYLGGDEAIASNTVARFVLFILRLFRLETIVNYGIALRVLCRLPQEKPGV